MYVGMYMYMLYQQMEGVDPGGALKMYAQDGQWDKCLELAGKQVGVARMVAIVTVR